MTVVQRRVPRRVRLSGASDEELVYLAPRLDPGRVEKLWNADLLTVHETEVLTEARRKRGLEP